MQPTKSSGMLMLSTSRVLTTLLGQFNVFERVDVDCSDLYDTNALESSSHRTTSTPQQFQQSSSSTLLFPDMEFCDSYLWITSTRGQKDIDGKKDIDGRKEGTHNILPPELPLLASTERLLRMLHEPIPGVGTHDEYRGETKASFNQFGLDPLDPLLKASQNVSRNVVVTSMEGGELKGRSNGRKKSNKSGKDKNESRATLLQNIDNAVPGDEIGNDHVGEVNLTDGKASKTSKEGDSRHEALQHLVQAPNLRDAINKALWDIHNFKQATSDDEVTKDETKPLQPRHVIVEQRRREALENQRKRLQQKWREQERQSEEISEIDEEDNNMEEAEDGVDELCRDAQDRTSAWIMLVAALNSLRAVTPILLEIVFHESRNNSEIQIKGVGLKKDGKGEEARSAMCWLFGRNVYTTVSVKQCKDLLERLIDLYLFFGVQNTSIPPLLPSQILCNRYEEVLTKTMRQLVDGFKIANSSAKKPSELPSDPWTNHHPFDAMEEADRLKLQAATTMLDTRLSLLTQSTSADAAVHAAYLKSIHGLHKYLEQAMARRFPGSRLSLYGSCLADLSLGKGADVDLSLYIDALSTVTKNYESGKISVKRYQDEVKRYVYNTCRCLEDRKAEFRDMIPVTRARVPVCKGTYILAENPHTSDGSIDFDICFLNDIAVSNSELLRQYSLVDPRVRSLMVTVKRWAKQHGISSTQDQCLSSYAWMNLVVFYLQHLGMVPNLQSSIMMKKAGLVPNPQGNYWHSVNNLDTCYLTWEQASTVWSLPLRLEHVSVTALLYGFYDFYAKQFPTSIFCVAIKSGGGPLIPKTAFRKCSLFWCIEDPFETCDSHCPHDLGVPTNEVGASKIVKCMQSAEAHLRKIVLEILDDDKRVDTVTELWPKPAAGKANIDKSSDKQQPSSKNGNGHDKRVRPKKAASEATRTTKPKSSLAADSNAHVPVVARPPTETTDSSQKRSKGYIPTTESDSTPAPTYRDRRKVSMAPPGNGNTNSPSTNNQSGGGQTRANVVAAAVTTSSSSPVSIPTSTPVAKSSKASKLSSTTAAVGSPVAAASSRAATVEKEGNKKVALSNIGAEVIKKKKNRAGRPGNTKLNTTTPTSAGPLQKAAASLLLKGIASLPPSEDLVSLPRRVPASDLNAGEVTKSNPPKKRKPRKKVPSKPQARAEVTSS